METDLHLLSRYHRHGDAAAFQSLVEAHAGMVHATASRVTRDAVLAQDVAQETFLALARSSGSAIQSVGAWLHHVAWQKARDMVRGESRRRIREEIAAEYFHVEQAEASWQQIEPLVDEAIGQLPERTRSLLIERYLEDRTQQEVAERHGISQSTVSRMLESGISELRAALESHGILCGTSLALLISTNSSQAAPASLTASLGKIALSGVGASATTALSLSLTPLLAMTTTKVLFVTASAAALTILMLKMNGGDPSPSSQVAQVPAAKVPPPLDDWKPAPARPAAANFNQSPGASLSLDEIWSEAMGLTDDRALIMAEFKKLGGSIKNGVVDDDIETIIRSGFKGDRTAFETSLQQKGLSLEQFKEQRRDAMIVAVMQSRVTRGITDPAAKKQAIEDWLSSLRKTSAAAKGGKGSDD